MSTGFNDYGCRGVPRLEHRWVQSEYSQAHHCSKCGVRRIDGTPDLAEGIARLLGRPRTKPRIRCRMVVIRGRHAGYRLYARAGGGYQFIGYQWFD